ncbi:MAG: methyltransferase domain-containing protein [Acidimicrobiia bacterium]
MHDPMAYKDDLARAYDSDVERRGAVTPDTWRTDIVDRFANDIRAVGARSVLELGCGTGQLARHLADQDFDVTAIDLSVANVEATQKRGIEAQVADFASLPFPDDSFDGAFAINSLLHVPPKELDGVFAEIARVLHRSAPLLVVVWGGINQQGPIEDEWLSPPRYFSTYTDKALLALSTPGFDFKTFEGLDVSEGSHDLHSQVLTLEAT